MPATLRPEHALGILDIADNAIVCVDADGRIVFFNQGAERIFGWRGDEIVGRDLALLMPARYRGDHGQRTADFLAGPDSARKMGERGVICGVRRDGSEFPAEATISRSDGPDGPILTAILQDISARRAWERELVAAREQAEAAVQAKSMFLANMSHEIRTPLNAVIGMTSLLLDSALDEEQHDYAATIRNSGEALLAIINDLLDFSKIDAGRLDLERHPFEVRTCVEEALDLLASSAGSKRIELACAIDPVVPATVLGDGARLRQVLVNLLSNAIKFTHHGEVVLEVESAPPAGGLQGLHGLHGLHALRFTVRDTGIGIPHERLRDIFEPFTQVDASTTRKYGGTGLGLAISRRLAQVMGGTLDVESEVGSGSAFTLALALEAVGGADSGDLLQERAAHLKGKRILIVDDNGTNRRILVRQALLWGMEPSAAASGVEALDLVRHGNGFDVAVLDMHMPDMNGAQLAQRIARHSEAPPLVLLTSVGERFRPGGTSDPLFRSALNKPVKPAALLEALLGALEVGALEVGAHEAPAAAAPAAPADPAPALDILIAEDNTINQKVIKQLLRHLGHRADVAANGLEVLAALERQDYGVILMDMQMPEMDGLEATRHLRLRFRGAGAPYIVAMTANALPGDRERCLEAGADAYLSKPVGLEQLRQALGVARASLAERRRLPAIVNPARMQELRATADGDDMLLRDVVAAFLDEAPGLLEQVGAAVRAGDGQRLAATAHYLLSSIDFIGAERMRLPCTNLELLGKANNAAAAHEELSTLLREYTQVEEVLRSMVGVF